MKELRLNIADCEDGGTIREIYKGSLGQLTLRAVPPGVKSERHRHLKADEWWVVIDGEAVIEVQDTDLSPVIRHVASGEWPKVTKVPCGAWHTIENVGEKTVVLLFHSSRLYDPEEPDRWT